MTSKDTTWLVESYCDDCEEGIIYENMVSSMGRYCPECGGTGKIIQTATMYETEYEVKEDYPEAIKVTQAPLGSSPLLRTNLIYKL